MKNLLRIALFCFFLPQVVFAQQKFDPTACEPYIDKEANKEYKKVRKLSPKEKIIELNKIMAKNENYHEALFDLAMAYVSIKADQKAKFCFEALLDICPNYSPYTWYHLGRIYESEKQFDKAADMYTKVISYANESVYFGDSEYNAAKAGLENSKKYVKVLSTTVPYDPKPVSGVSTKLDEYLGILSPDNKLMYFIRKYPDPKSDIGFKEVFMSAKNIGNFEFEDGEAMAPPFNSRFNLGAASLTADNNEMYLVICEGNISNNCDIYYSKRENLNWTQPIALPNGINAKGYWDSHPTVSYDGKQMVFASNRPGSKGMDLYYTEKDEAGNWKTPKALPAEINTDNNEGHPFLHSDSKTLYFSSRGHDAVGGYDFFMSKQNPDGSWTKAKNLGSPINTEKDERGIFVSLDGTMAFFFGDGVKGGIGGLDQFKFPLYEEVRPEKIKMVKGQLQKEDELAVMPSKIEVKNLRTNEVSTIDVNVNNGDFVAVVSAEDDHIITVDEPGIAFVSQLIEKDDPAPLVEEKVLEVKKIEVGQAYRLNNVNFATNSSVLEKKAILIIDEFYEFLKRNPSIRFAIHGHTDNVGDDNSNLILSHKRAEAVYNYLVSKGIDKARMEYKGFGETKPIMDNSTEAGRLKNRRTEFVILSL